MRYEIGLVDFADSPAIEKRGPYETREDACDACEKANEELYPDKVVTQWTSPKWMWAREGEIPMRK